MAQPEPMAVGLHTAALLEALGAAERTERAFASEGWGAPISALAPLFPKSS